MQRLRATSGAFYDTLEARGVSRRDFLRFCGSIAVMVGLTQSAAPRIAEALEAAGNAPLKPAIWLSQGLCTGCTESTAQSAYPDAGQIVLEILSVNYWETLSAGAGKSVEEAVAKTIAEHRGKFILIVEGAIMQGFDGNALRVAGRPAIEDFKTIAAAAEAIVAVGSCAVDGGWVKARPNPANATGVMQVVDPAKVVNLPTCPVNPEWVVAVLVDYLLLGKLPVLDAERRPALIFGQTIHDDCPRRGHFENSEFVEAFGTTEEARNFCLYKMGCKGPQTKSQCPIVRWNSRASWCVEAGSPCIGCASFDWVDRNTPFLERMPDVLGVSPQTVGVVAGGLALAGLVAHGIAQTATGRMGHGGPPEEPDTPRPVDAVDDELTEPSTDETGVDPLDRVAADAEDEDSEDLDLTFGQSDEPTEAFEPLEGPAAEVADPDDLGDADRDDFAYDEERADAPSEDASGDVAPGDHTPEEGPEDEAVDDDNDEEPEVDYEARHRSMPSTLVDPDESSWFDHPGFGGDDR